MSFDRKSRYALFNIADMYAIKNRESFFPLGFGEWEILFMQDFCQWTDLESLFHIVVADSGHLYVLNLRQHLVAFDCRRQVL